MLSLLKRKFVVAWTNNETKPYVGNSLGYTSEQTAIGTTNGAGAHNVQIIILSPDSRVLHALPGFWHPEDFARELRLSLVLHSLWKQKGQSVKDRKDMYRRIQLAAIQQAPKETFDRSLFQAFDGRAEQQKRLLNEKRDTFSEQGRLKPTNVIVHERMARMPFMHWSGFRLKLDEFADLGQRFYDLNATFDNKGKPFKKAAATAKRMDKLFAKQLAKKQKNAKRRR